MGIIHSPLQPAMKKMLSVQRPAFPGVKIALGWHIENGRNDVVSHNGADQRLQQFCGI